MKPMLAEFKERIGNAIDTTVQYLDKNYPIQNVLDRSSITREDVHLYILLEMLAHLESIEQQRASKP